jgi:recombination associated protein RdgC
VTGAPHVAEARPARDDRAFLGEEFLTWLWWRAETGRGEYDLGGGRIVGIALEAPLVLRAAGEDGAGKRPEQVLRYGEPLRGAEAAAALKRGKLLSRARLVVGDGGDTWNATFDAASFSLRSIVTPEPDSDVAPDEHAASRIRAFGELPRLLDAVFEQFLSERLSPDFRTKTLRSMRAWIRAK